MAKIKIGTAGWDYKDWIGPFYPKQLEKRHHLEYFSNYFDIVEINSTFYHLPSVDMIKNWKLHVPTNFLFIIKVWQKISHNLDDPDLDSNIFKFFSTLEHLNEKIKAFLIQFPPWFKYTENHLDKLKLLLNKLPSEYIYLIELRDNSWFNPESLSKVVDGHKRILGTTYMPGIIPYYLENQKIYYIRLIGDRKLTVFNRIQRDQKDALNNLYKNVQNLANLPEVYEIFIIVNNHFQGSAPESVNYLRKKFGITYPRINKQRSLTEYIN
ncbi:MAG: DUF72 domain-containing protein [Candidatus Thorarchaeota archaeon]